MGRKPLTIDEYEIRGAQCGMRLLGEAPARTTFPTFWECEICGRKHYKSLNAIVFHSPCICRTNITLKPSDYQELAKQLGIKWLGQYPKTNKELVMWQNGDGEIFNASYLELAYGKIPKRIMSYINKGANREQEKTE